LRNCENAIAVASKEFEIPLIIDASDIVSALDEPSMLTYVSFFRDYAEGQRNIEEEFKRHRAAEEAAARKRAAVVRALTWTASGPGLVKGCKDRNNFFMISNAQNGTAQTNEFSIIVKGPETFTFLGTVIDTDLASRFEGCYSPPVPGSTQLM